MDIWIATHLGPKNWLLWQLAKLGVRWIKAWAKDQEDIDGDDIQVTEILYEWFGQWLSIV